MGSLYNQRKMLLRLSINDFHNKFVGSYFGILWAFVQPIMTIFVFWFVFQVGFRTPPVEKVPFILWFMAGIVPWFYFSEAWASGTNGFLEYNYLVKKIVFQIDLIPLVKIVSALYIHLFFLAFTVVVFLIYGQPLTLYMLQLFYYLFCLIALTASLTLLTSALIIFFRDLIQILSIVLQFGMWLTPIMWPYHRLPEQWRWVLNGNPMYYIVEGYRDALFNHVWFWQKPLGSLCFWGITLFWFLLGSLVYRKLKVHFADAL